MAVIRASSTSGSSLGASTPGAAPTLSWGSSSGETSGSFSGAPAPPLVLLSNSTCVDLSAGMGFCGGVASITAGVLAESTGVDGVGSPESLAFLCSWRTGAGEGL